MKKYDSTIVIDGTLGKEERESLVEKIQSSLEKFGVKIDRIVRWGQHTLAYEIKKRSQGYYLIFYYSADSSIIEKFERELRINENVLRYMTIVFEGDYPSYIGDENIIDSSYSAQKTEISEIPESIEKIEEEVESYEDVGFDDGIETDNFLDENEDIKGEDNISDSEITVNNNETQNIIDKEN